MKAIGVFDSGVGGLTVAKEIIEQLPGEDIIYFGDTARVPYGIKSKETIIRFSIENILFLLKNDVKLICVACNTASSLALPVINRHFRVPLVGVITPAAREAVYATQNKRIGVIGTHATVRSRAYEEEIKRLDPAVKVTTIACPLFVPFVEEGVFKGELITKVAQMYLQPLKDKKVDTVILGCTHYPVIKPVISRVLGEQVRLIDSAKQVAVEIKNILTTDRMLNKGSQGRHDFFVSDNPEWFTALAKTFLGRPIKNARKADQCIA